MNNFNLLFHLAQMIILLAINICRNQNFFMKFLNGSCETVWMLNLFFCRHVVTTFENYCNNQVKDKVYSLLSTFQKVNNIHFPTFSEGKARNAVSDWKKRLFES